MEEVKENKFEQRVFQLPGKGSVEENRDRLKMRLAFSPNEPTGIYAKPDEEIAVEIKEANLLKRLSGHELMTRKGQKSSI